MTAVARFGDSQPVNARVLPGGAGRTLADVGQGREPAEAAHTAVATPAVPQRAGAVTLTSNYSDGADGGHRSASRSGDAAAVNC
jgi:hypothetical protein